MADNGVNIKLFLHRLSAGPMDIAYIHEKVHAIDGCWPMRWVEYDHEEIPISMDKYFIHECGRSTGIMQHVHFSKHLVIFRVRVSRRIKDKRTYSAKKCVF